jgi:putative heme-binding domain-containing protein
MCRRLPASEGRAQLVRQAAGIVGVRRRGDELKAILETIASALGRRDDNRSGAWPPIDSMVMLGGLADGLERSGTPLGSLVSAPASELKGELDRLAPIWPAAGALAASSRPQHERLAALDVLAHACAELADPVIITLLASSQPTMIQAAAVRAIGRSGRPELGAKAVDRWPKLTIATRRELLATLASTPRFAECLVRALEREIILPSEIDLPTRETLARLAEKPLKERAALILSRFVPQERSAVIAQYQSALTLAGNAQRGAAVFGQNCQTCHQRQGEGHKVGPDLSGVAGRAPDALLVDILDPNHEVAADFAMVRIATRAGQVVSGVLAEETATSLKLRRGDGIEETVLRSEIDELKATSHSLMPEGLEKVIDAQAMADLIAYLRGQR